MNQQHLKKIVWINNILKQTEKIQIQEIKKYNLINPTNLWFQVCKLQLWICCCPPLPLQSLQVLSDAFLSLGNFSSHIIYFSRNISKPSRQPQKFGAREPEHPVSSKLWDHRQKLGIKDPGHPLLEPVRVRTRSFPSKSASFRRVTSYFHPDTHSDLIFF